MSDALSISPVLWRRRLQLAGVFGAAFGIAFAVVIGGARWWNNRPRPWDDRTIHASFLEMNSEPDANSAPRTIRFRYAIRNTGSSDYRLGKQSVVTIMFSRKEAVREARLTKLTLPLLVPAGKSGEIELTVPYDELSDLIPSQRLERFRPEDIQSVEPRSSGPTNVFKEAVTLVPSELLGFVLYDSEHRYRVDLPKNW